MLLEHDSGKLCGVGVGKMLGDGQKCHGQRGIHVRRMFAREKGGERSEEWGWCVIWLGERDDEMEVVWISGNEHEYYYCEHREGRT